MFVYLNVPPYEDVCASADTWPDVVGIEPHMVVDASGGAATDVRRG